MRVIVTIPAYNEEATIGQAIREIPRRFAGIDAVEVLVVDDGSSDRTVAAARQADADHIVSLKRNAGLTVAFSTALQAAVERGADIIVNTDADCQYVGVEIERLIGPILRGEADLVSGDRQVGGLTHMPFSKKLGNRIGSAMLRYVAESPLVDASSGFRAFSRECALRLTPAIGNTYTHQTIIQAVHGGMVVKEVPVTFRPSARAGGGSRLITNVGSHILRSGLTIVRTLTAYRPLSVLGTAGLLVLAAGLAVGMIPVLAYVQGDTEGHLQSLVAATVLSIAGLQLLVFALLADAVSTTRRISEETLYRIRKSQATGGLRDVAELRFADRHEKTRPTAPSDDARRPVAAEKD